MQVQDFLFQRIKENQNFQFESISKGKGSGGKLGLGSQPRPPLTWGSWTLWAANFLSVNSLPWIPYFWGSCSLWKTVYQLRVHVCVLSCFSRLRLFATPWTVGKDTGVGCQILLQGIFLTQGSPAWGDPIGFRVQYSAITTLNKTISLTHLSYEGGILLHSYLTCRKMDFSLTLLPRHKCSLCPSIYY